MLQITLKKSRSKSFNDAVFIMKQLGAELKGGAFFLSIQEHDIPNAYNYLLGLIEIIGKWKNVDARFRGKSIDLYRFVFQQYNSIASCGSERTASDYGEFCRVKYDVPTWGCRLIESVLLYNTGDGNYERSGIYWYNYGFFDNSGMWIIDKDRIYARITKEIQNKALDVCPYFNIAAVEKLVFRDLPDYIIPDNYSYRLHYEKVYENGLEIIKAVNIRHINDVRNAPGLINRDIVYRLQTAHDYFKALPPDLPSELKRSIKRMDKEIDNKNAPATRAFDGQGNCKN